MNERLSEAVSKHTILNCAVLEQYDTLNLQLRWANSLLKKLLKIRKSSRVEVNHLVRSTMTETAWRNKRYVRLR